MVRRVRKRTLKGKQQQKRNYKSNNATVTVPVRASGSAPLRRSPRLNPIPDAYESDSDESDFFDSDSDESDTDKPRGRSGSMTDAEMVRYEEQVCKSDGFDVEHFSEVRGFGIIQPLNLSNAVYNRMCIKVSERAIDQIHKRRERRAVKPQTPLKFVKVLKAMHQICDMMRYYVTFEAKNGGGETKIYQTLARWRRFPLVEDNFTVLVVREYKKDKGDQVIGIHSLRELETQLNAASTTCRLAILYFYKARPCRFISPFYESLARKYPKVVFLKVDIEEAEAEDVTKEWKIRRAPYFFFLKNGKQVDKVVGIDADELERKVKLHSRKQGKRVI